MNSNLILPAILLLAAFLRIIHTGDHSLWVDELFSLKFASYSLPDLFSEVAGFDNHPPTYYLLLHFWIQLFGDSELSLRAPSAIFSILCVYFTFKVGELLFDRRVASIAALLLALSGFSVYYAQEARMYSLLAFASVLSVYFLLKLQQQQTPRTLFHYVWSTTLLIYTHLYGIFVIVAENIYILVVLYQFGDRITGIPLKKWVTAQGAIFLLSLPWFGLLINRIVNISREGFWVEVPTMNSVIKTFATFSGTSGGLALWIALMLLGALSFLIIRTEAGRKILIGPSLPREGRHVFLLLLLLFVPVLLPYLISQFTTPIYIIRSTIAGQFAFFLLVANGIVHLRWRYLRYAALILLLAISSRVLFTKGYIHYRATQFREAVEYIAMHRFESDKIILCSNSHLDWPFKYYARKANIPGGIGKLNATGAFPDQSKGKRVWFVRRTDISDQCEQIPQAVTDRYLKLEDAGATFRNLELTVFLGKG